MIDWTHFLGIPFVKGGRDVERGLDCWGLLRYVYQLAKGAELPLYPVPAGSLADSQLAFTSELASARWEEVTEPLEGDAVALGGKHISHVGVFIIANGVPSLLHSHLRGVSVIQPLRYLREHGFPIQRFFRYAHSH